MINIKDGKILIIDDNEANVVLLEVFFKTSGFNNISRMINPMLLESYLEKETFDLILLDLNMPNRNGLECLEILKNYYTDWLPVIIITANTDKALKIEALQNGAKDYVMKPFDKSEIMNRMKNTLEAYMMFKEIKLRNQDLESIVKQRTKKLELMADAILEKLGKASEYRDNETGEHVLRMSKFSYELAKAYGLPNEDCEIILKSSPMHDIGKIGIPDSVLLKPGLLTKEEREIMNQHVIIGAKILEDNNNIRLLDIAKNIALEHHEKFDGSGYPFGKVGEAISIEARIVSLCDVFDALTTKRPYKEPWSVEKSLEYIVAQKNKHFDPKLVDLFITIQDKILKIKDEIR